uniref:9-cis-epoxycarotenoid dioxygenase n=1 Tax=Nelumbo nucifera TaxID=4432 RepID=A0A822ZS78_NELNU|nr:TPA_asm: hypothetical protein HUJ06_018711 [Nelumbo nucifera]
MGPPYEETETLDLSKRSRGPLVLFSDCIQGVYVRNDANPLFEPVVGHHFFDGDGMVYAVSTHDGSASYICPLGRPIFSKAIGELHSHSGIARLLFYARFNRRLLAMFEDDLPYQVRITPSGDLETVGRYDLQGQLQSAMIAHPKLDPYYSFSLDGQKSSDIEIPVTEPIMMHDFAITDRFVVILDQQVVFKLQEMIRDGSPVVYDKNKISWFGILDNNANAWEELKTDEVVVIGSYMTLPNSIFNECEEGLKSVLLEIRLNLRIGKSTRRSIISNSQQLNLEAGLVPPNTSS